MWEGMRIDDGGIRYFFYVQKFKGEGCCDCLTHRYCFRRFLDGIECFDCMGKGKGLSVIESRLR